MQELIKIDTAVIGDEEVNAVNAREIWRKLKSKADFATWIKQQIKRAQLVENYDFEKLHKKVELSKTGQTKIEYIITLDSAKNICMMSGTSKGKEIRKYFIEIEKQYRKSGKSTNLSAIKEATEALLNSVTTIAISHRELMSRVESLEKEKNKPATSLPRTKKHIPRTNRSIRNKILQLVDDIVENTGADHLETWGWVYEVFEDYNDLDITKISRGMNLSKIDAAERIGMLKQLHSAAILCYEYED